MVLLIALGMIPEGSGFKCYQCEDCGDATKLEGKDKECPDPEAKHCSKITADGKVGRGCTRGSDAVSIDCALNLIGSCSTEKPPPEKFDALKACITKAGGKLRTAMEEPSKRTECACKGELCNSGWMKSSSVLLLTTAILVAGGATQSSWLGA